VIDMRDRQVQDAVNMYYLINNLPPPATAEGTADQVPSSVAPPGLGRKEVDEDEAGLEFNDGAGGGLPDEADAIANDIAGRRFGEEFPVVRPEVALPETPEEVNGLSKQRLAELITAYRMFDPLLTTRTGAMMTTSTMVRTIEKEVLISVVLSYLGRRDGAGRRRVDNRAGGGVGNVGGGGAAAGDDDW
jgi:hypothetical protein